MTNLSFDGNPYMDTSNFKEVFTSDETKRLRAELAAAEARIAELEAQGRQDISVWFDTTATHNTNVELRQQLAALQALLQKKDEALSIAMIGGDYLPTEREELQRVLSLTSPTDALAPYLRCVEALELACHGLQWYRDAYPEADSEADYPDILFIHEALAAVKGEK